VYSAGWTTLFLAGFYWAIDVMGSRWWTYPLVVVGMNSIAAYVIGQVFAGWFRSLVGAWVNLLDPLLGPTGVSITHRVLFFIAAWGILWWLYRRRIFFKL
jgi:predicted acyltransferase